MLSKRGIASRTQAAEWIRAGRVRLEGRVVRDPEHPVPAGAARIEVDGRDAAPADRVYVALNKSRGLVTTAADEKGRDTIYRCLEGQGLPWLAPVGRLDQASEGLLLLTNDPAWAAGVTDPARGPTKLYHVQVEGRPGPDALSRMRDGVVAEGERLAFADVRVLREGQRQAWLEVTLDEGRNRQIRRTLAALGHPVRRLVRVRIGALALGELAKGQWRHLTPDEVGALAATP